MIKIISEDIFYKINLFNFENVYFEVNFMLESKDFLLAKNNIHFKMIDQRLAIHKMKLNL
jgi:hypothetical protein